MKIIILNGSPKSEKSVTMQSMKYLEQIYGEHEFEYIHIFKEINKYEKSKEELEKLCEKIQRADGVIWAFPLYHALVHSYYKRFIELILERNLIGYFTGKYTSAFSTSIHYADIHAHNFMRGICEDLSMNYVEYLSHEMNDLTRERRRKELKLFFENLLIYIREGLTTNKLFKPVSKSTFKYNAGETNKFINTDKKIIIITDAKKEDHNLKEMIKKYKSYLKNAVEVLNLNDIDIKGPCLGCCKCAAENICVYHDKDGYRNFLDYVIENGDIVIFAGTIRDRYLSSRFKLYYDRSFCYTHIPFLNGKQIGYMISGKLSEVQNLRQILELYTGEDKNLIGFITDESEDSAVIDKEIYTFAKMGVSYCERNYFKADTFLGVASKNLFSDAIQGELGGIFVGDYKYYKRNRMLKKTSFKQKIQGAVMRYFMGKEGFRKHVQKNMIDYMATGHKKTLEKGV